jgi:16S rRNA processing protein RimM
VEDIVIAKVVKARGIRGEVACDLFTDFPEQFRDLKVATVAMPNGERLALEIESHWFHKERVILKFAGFNSMNAAETLIGGRLVIDESHRARLREREFFEYDLVGSEVVTTSGIRCGVVTSLLQTGGAVVLVVEGAGAREHMIPFVDDICISVDTDRKLITVDPPEGLLDL